MRAMVLEKVGHPLKLMDVPRPEPSVDEVLIKVRACGVCRTDLHIMDGELEPANLPLILGHQIVGVIEKLGPGASRYAVGDRVGVAWLGGSCHLCEFCTSERENLCDKAVYTGYLRQGGYAEYCCALEEFIFPLPPSYSDLESAPLLCAGLIGYRAFRLAGSVKTIGLYGFGSSAHLLAQIAHFLGCKVYVFTKPGDEKTQEFARSLGVAWAGGSDQMPPVLLDAALLFAPVGTLYPQALKAVKKGGRVISAGIHMSDIPSFSYSLLWEERSMSSVANLTRRDGHELLQLVQTMPLRIKVNPFPLEEANAALDALRTGRLDGSLVLKL